MITPGQAYDERDPSDPLGLTFAQRHCSNINTIMERWMDDINRGVGRTADGARYIDGEVITDDLSQRGLPRTSASTVGR